MLPGLAIGSLRRRNVAPGVYDRYWDKRSALLHFDGSNGSTTITDERGHTWTAAASAQISTAQSVFGGSSLLLGGSGDYVYTASHADFAFGSGDFDIDCRVYPTGYASNNGGSYASCLVGQSAASNAAFYFMLSGTSSSFTTLVLGLSGNGSSYSEVTASAAVSLNTWNHFRASRVAGKVYLFRNGTLLNAGGTTLSTTVFSSSASIKIGALAHDGTFLRYLTGHIDEVRITKGRGESTASFDLPDRAYPSQ